MPPRPFSAFGALAAWPVTWPVASQQRSRRNAMIASTALAERRRERVETEAFLAAHGRRHQARERRTVREARVI